MMFESEVTEKDRFKGCDRKQPISGGVYAMVKRLPNARKISMENPGPALSGITHQEKFEAPVAVEYALVDA